MSERIEQSIKNHKKGYNCAQAVTCAYCDAFDTDEKTAFRMAEAFGFGMGTMETCGAVTGMALLVGMKISDGELSSPATKRESYKKIKEMTKAFLAVNGTVSCRELKGAGGGEPIRSCDGCIEDAAKIVEEYLL